VAVASVAVIVARRPDAVTNPQFWAEDGAAWFVQAHAYGGFHSLFIAHAGYLQTASRLVAWLAQAFPMASAPLVFSLTAIAAQALPAVLLATRRFDRIIPDWRIRALLIALYLALPNTGEVHANLTNAQWHLALLIPLLVIATPPVTWAGRVLDVALMLLAGLSGPFCLLAAPCLIVYWWLGGRGRWLTALVAADLVAAGIQLIALFTTISSPGTGARYPGLSTNLGLLARIIAGQVVAGLALGKQGYRAVYPTDAWHSSWLIAAVVILGAAPVLAAAIRGPRELRLFLAYAAAVFAASLLVPIGGSVRSVWEVLLAPGNGQRYAFLPMIAIGVSLVWVASRRPIPLKAMGAAALLLVAVMGVRLDGRFPPYIDYHWRATVAACEAKPVGSPCNFTTNPSPSWSFQIIRR
jgi:hypothetical protein